MLRVAPRARVLARASQRRLFSTPVETTFSQQKNLPRLPIPTLEDTAKRYLKSIEPLVSSDEYKVSEKAVRAFIASDGLGPVLQERLHAVDKKAPYSWLEEIWLKKAYLEWRDPSYINVNWAANIGDNPELPIIPAESIQRGKLTDVQVSRAARIISHMLEANDAINTESFPIDKSRGEPLDMDQFKNQFGTTRVPKAGCDEIKSTWPATANHILLMYRNVPTAVPVYGASGERASSAQIEKQLRAAAAAVDAQIEAHGAQPSVANLTAAHRDLWSTAYASLEKNAANRASLDAVESALFGVCLDVDVDPSSLSDVDSIWAQYAHAQNDSGSNRWFDKAIELIFLQNGKMGANCEHTPVDALTTGRLLFESLAKERNILGSEHNVSSLPPPQPLQWNLTPDIVSAISEARESAGKLAADLRLKFGLAPDFGAKWIKSLGVSPDAFFQVALQAAYLREHGRPAATYESANLRKFLHGRTETIRSATTEAFAFSRVLDDKDVDPKKKIELFRHAAATQTALTQAAGNGQGVDRHLLGLRVQIRPEETDRATLFNDPAYPLSSTFILSTSNTGAGDMFRGGFAPVTGDGYGVNYAVDPKNIKISISDWRSSHKTDAPRFADTIVQTLQDVQKIGAEVLGQ